MKLASKLPEGIDNGLVRIVRDLVDAPEDVHLVVAAVDCSRLTTDIDTGHVIPTVRIRQIEAILDAEVGAVVQRALTQARRDRTGQTLLDVDPDTGEILDGGAT